MPSSPGEVIVVAIVLCAVAYFARHIYGLFKGTASCCGGGSDSGKDHGKAKKTACHGSCDACSEKEAEKRLGITYKKADASASSSRSK